MCLCVCSALQVVFVNICLFIQGIISGSLRKREFEKYVDPVSPKVLSGRRESVSGTLLI